MPFFLPSGPRLRTALPVASRKPSGSSGVSSSAPTMALQSLSISFAVTPSLSAVFMSVLMDCPTARPRAKSDAGRTYVQPRALGSSQIWFFATPASTLSRLRPAREKRVRYGLTPPTDRAQPVRPKTSAADRPVKLPSRPWRWAHHARSFDWSMDDILEHKEYEEHQTRSGGLE